MTEQLIKWRKDAGLTQAEAGDLLGVNQPTIAKWESGQVSPGKCLLVHQKTLIPLHELRPDMYPAPAEAQSSEAA